MVRSIQDDINSNKGDLTYLKNHNFPKSFLTFGLDRIQQLISLGLGKTDRFLDGKDWKHTRISLGKPE